MPLRGRGAYYGPSRALSEWVVARAMRNGWAAGAVKRAGLQRRVVTREHAVSCARWPEGAPPLRLAFASDLHAGPTTHPSLHEEAARAIVAARPDVVLLGGDYVYLEADYVESLVPILADVHAPAGKFAVLGNHDLWADERVITDALARAGFTVLVNASQALPPPFDHVSICGLDDPWVGTSDPRAAFEGARDVRVLLMHAPEGLLHVGDERFDVGVCGHTHGGHIALPGGIPIVAAGPLSRRYSHGRYELAGGRPLLVSRGVGATESPFRLFADPDVMVVSVGR